ncbi:RNA-binding domain-containing protein [Marinisporobacter balticus]|uniref:ATP-dependent DNA helicase RecG n=1 Tax=Marinisporobacter balticus TaxID=2018667 RepID=A0A4R2K646_9FIRM|nr:RNA-binding domain-containing protein [Marinisporobacter balticus]TCO68733.1 ATP-dependent DNA helicase RecG [Marinisporobacter balticus]
MNNEGLNIEYKREYVDDIRKTVIAFANTNGGKIMIGIADNGTIVGVEDADNVMLKATNAVRDSIKPDITLFTTCEREIIEGKTVIVLTVQKGTACPYYLSGKGIRPEGVYIRQGASSVPATETAILKMIKETDGDNYEEIRSLNQELTFDYLQKEFDTANIKIEKSQMKTLHLIGEDGLYSNLGLLLSDQCSHTIKLAVFEGTTKEIFKDRYEFSGSLLKQLREGYSFIDRYNRTRAEFEELTRIDKRDYPTTAIREALLNSIVHRDYSFSGSTLISIFDDRIEIVTIGGLVKGISKDDMLLGVSILRNKNLANVFYRLKMIEAYGTGIPKIMENYQCYSIQPKIEITDNAFKITLFNTMFTQEQNKNKPTRKVFYTEGEQRVLDMFVSADTIKRKDIEKVLSISQPMAVKHLKSLLEKSAIEKIGSGKNVRYKLK